jgi:hypothetical protein
MLRFPGLIVPQPLSRLFRRKEGRREGFANEELNDL